MNRDRSRKPILLVSLGLLGGGLFLMANAYGLPRALDHDFVKGLCLGVCLGVEIHGGYLLYRQRRGLRTDC